MEPDYCDVHKCFTWVCGGHKEVFTDLGWEVLQPDEPPKGTPLEPTEEQLEARWSKQG